MRWALLVALLLACVLRVGWQPAIADHAEHSTTEWPMLNSIDESQAGPTFCAYDLFVDSGSASLAAYQLEFKAAEADMQIVGVEGGDTPAFKNAPFYDPEAMQHNRVVIGAYSTDDRANLPAGTVRVARIHVMLPPGGHPNPVANLQTAGGPAGSKIDATVSWALVPEAMPSPSSPARDPQKGAL